MEDKKSQLSELKLKFLSFIAKSYLDDVSGCQTCQLMWTWDQLVKVIGLVLENIWHNSFADATWFDILLTYVMKFMHFI